MDVLKEALMKHMAKAKKPGLEHSEELKELSADHAPDLQAEVQPDVGDAGHPVAPNAVSPVQDEKSLMHMKLMEALKGHGGPLASHASKACESAKLGDKDEKEKQHEKMASIQKHKAMGGAKY